MNLETLTDRDVALTVACPVARCRAPVGVECRNVNTGRALVQQSAHVARLQLAGIEPGRAWLIGVSRETSSGRKAT